MSTSDLPVYVAKTEERHERTKKGIYIYMLYKVNRTRDQSELGKNKRSIYRMAFISRNKFSGGTSLRIIKGMKTSMMLEQR